MAFPSAVAFRGMGLYPFPLVDATPGDPNSGKRPRLSDWQILAVHAEDAQRETWDRNAWNLGLSLGPSRLVAIDSDTPDAEDWAVKRLPPTPWVTRTAKGRHRFYRLWDGFPAPSNKVRVHASGIDRKSAGGYVVAPGSVHWTGCVYEPEGDWETPLDRLPTYDPNWFPSEPRTLAMTPARAYAAPKSTPQGRVDVIQRAKAYLDHVKPAIQGDGGDEHTYKVCCILVQDFALDPGDALAVLIPWNNTCSPPWAAYELEEKLQHAMRYAKGSKGSKVDVPPPILAPIQLLERIRIACPSPS